MTKVDCRCLASSVVKWLQMRQRCTSDAWMGSNHLSGEYCKILISYIAEFIRYKSDVKTLRQKIALVCETEKISLEALRALASAQASVQAISRKFNLLRSAAHGCLGM